VTQNIIDTIQNNIPTIDDKVKLITPEIYKDDRGFLVETFRQENFKEYSFVQQNHSRSSRGIVRGLHFQEAPGQAKLVRCARGKIFDVAVDLRKESITFGEWRGFFIDDENHQQVLIPEGFAHGFCVVSEFADVVYMLSTYYDPKKEKSLKWNDEKINITWPLADSEIKVSKKDKEALTLREIKGELNFD
jgi:dTDP-4-dehydrorhamnose 3,5-epimerase